MAEAGSTEASAAEVRRDVGARPHEPRPSPPSARRRSPGGRDGCRPAEPSPARGPLGQRHALRGEARLVLLYLRLQRRLLLLGEHGSGRPQAGARFVRRAHRRPLLIRDLGPGAVGRLLRERDALLLETRLVRVRLLRELRLLLVGEDGLLRRHRGDDRSADTEADDERRAGHEEGSGGLPHCGVAFRRELGPTAEPLPGSCGVRTLLPDRCETTEGSQLRADGLRKATSRSQVRRRGTALARHNPRRASTHRRRRSRLGRSGPGRTAWPRATTSTSSTTARRPVAGTRRFATTPSSSTSSCPA